MITNDTITTNGNTYKKEKGKTCEPGGKGVTTLLKIALHLCDQFPCKGIYDEKCDGISVVVCHDITLVKEDTSGCTYVKNGNILLLLSFSFECYYWNKSFNIVFFY